jgi:uncharacterized SAM-binding protein YcdF (DUF218 family)
VQAGRSYRWAWIGFAFRVATALFVLAVLGFPIFVWSLPRASADPGDADAIVALTGGEGRLAAGLELLELGKGERLLISGVHSGTTRGELFAAVGQLPQRAACCVDLGRGAENTIGNAGETAVWANRHGYRSVIVVTASYHMPRSLMELRAVMPETRLVPYAVFPDRVRLSEWWSDPETTGVLVGEYVKFLASAARLGVTTRFGTQTAATPAQAIIENAPGEPAETPDSAAQDLGQGWVSGQH